MNRGERTRGWRCGFTLVELLTAIAIIGILAAILIPSVGGARNSARRAETKLRFAQWAIAVEQFRQEYGYAPSIAAVDGRVDATRFLATLTGRDQSGSRLRDSALNGNSKGIAFLTLSENELVQASDGTTIAELADGFGNSEIVVLIDADGDGAIRGAEMQRTPVRSGNSQIGYGSAISPDPAFFPSDGIRASVAFYSAGAGRDEGDLVFSWR